MTSGESSHDPNTPPGVEQTQRPISRGQAALNRLRADVEAEARRPRASIVAEITDCEFVGGHEIRARFGEQCRLVFTTDGVRIDPVGGDRVFVPYREVTTLGIGGPGATRSGGGFVGGGFGLEGAAEGMLIASALNALTTRTRIDTVLCVQSTSSELFFHISDETPDALRRRLSPAFTAIRQQQQTALPLAAPRAQTDVVTRLQALADLLDKELLTRAEFDELKKHVLADMRAQR